MVHMRNHLRCSLWEQVELQETLDRDIMLDWVLTVLAGLFPVRSKRTLHIRYFIISSRLSANVCG